MNIGGTDIHALLQQWQGAIVHVLNMLLHNPSSNIAFWLFLIAAFAACRIAFVKVVHTMNLNDLGTGLFHVAVLVGLAGVLLPLAAVHIYKPEWLQSADQTLYIVGVAVGSSLLISIPLINAMMKENYFKTALAWGVSLLAVLAAIAIMGVLSDAFFQGVESYKKGYERNEETKKAIR